MCVFFCAAQVLCGCGHRRRAAHLGADNLPSAVMASDVLQKVAFKTWPVSGDLLYGYDGNKDDCDGNNDGVMFKSD